MRVGVLASHEGTTLQALFDAAASGAMEASVGVVVSNNSGSGALRRARAAAVPALHLSSVTHPHSGELDASICSALRSHDIDVVVLAGYMKKLGPETLDAYRGRVLNTHPGPLPAFGGQGMYGERVHRAVLEAGVSKSAVSIFVVTEEYDAGPVIASREVDVVVGDSVEALAARVQAAERELLPEVVDRFVRDVVGGGSPRR